jgi:hypothetical protein
MKRALFSIPLLAALSVAGSGGTSAALAGQEGHGGDSYAAQFVAIADQLVNELGGLPVDERYGVNPVRLATTIDTTQVDSTDQALYLDGGTRLVDAINYPDQRLIMISRPSWDEMSFVRRQLLVLHEYCSLLSLDDANYQISAKVLLDLGQIEPDPSPSSYPTPDPSPSGSPSPDPDPSGAPLAR